MRSVIEPPKKGATFCKVNADTSAAIMEMLLGDTPRTNADLVALTGATRNTIDRYLKALRKRGICYVAKWRNSANGSFDRAYLIGRKEDAERPPTLTRSTKRRIYYAKKTGCQLKADVIAAHARNPQKVIVHRI
jgi:predicted ArsR family transcriptional regulator